MNAQDAVEKERVSSGDENPGPADEQRWKAVCERDPAADGRFIYGVVTTGVYCRPSCPSRQALRRNVVFFDTVEQARAAGLRSCKRCQPDHELSNHAVIVEKACRYIDSSEQPPTLESVARHVGVSLFHLHRIFRKVTGTTPRQYAESKRSQRLRDELHNGSDVTGAVYAAGFGSPSRFYEKATEILGMRPSRYRSGGAEVRIIFAAGECSLGSILVAATESGVCDVRLGDDADELVRELQDRFPRAELLPGDEQFNVIIASIISGLDEGLTPELPLDVRGTAFQERVWRALRDIPPGETRTYAQIAADIGRPEAVRAVANACASNTIAVLIPCHRVVRADGSLGGYRWGIERKRTLLETEKAGAS